MSLRGPADSMKRNIQNFLIIVFMLLSAILFAENRKKERLLNATYDSYVSTIDRIVGAKIYLESDRLVPPELPLEQIETALAETAVFFAKERIKHHNVIAILGYSNGEILSSGKVSKSEAELIRKYLYEYQTKSLSEN